MPVSSQNDWLFSRIILIINEIIVYLGFCMHFYMQRFYLYLTKAV